MNSCGALQTMEFSTLIIFQNVQASNSMRKGNSLVVHPCALGPYAISSPVAFVTKAIRSLVTPNQVHVSYGQRKWCFRDA